MENKNEILREILGTHENGLIKYNNNAIFRAKIDKSLNLIKADFTDRDKLLYMLDNLSDKVKNTKAYKDRLDLINSGASIDVIVLNLVIDLAKIESEEENKEAIQSPNRNVKPTPLLDFIGATATPHRVSFDRLDKIMSKSEPKTVNYSIVELTAKKALEQRGFIFDNEEEFSNFFRYEVKQYKYTKKKTMFVYGETAFMTLKEDGRHKTLKIH